MAKRKKKEDPVDAVFVIGNGSVDGNEELRYALRDIEKNCKFVRDVYICGECPSWVDKTKVKHLQWPDRFRHAKDANIIDKLRHACEHPEIAKRILFCSDDQFQTKKCEWEDFRPRYLKAFYPDDDWYGKKRRVWHSRLKKTLEREVARRRESGMDTSHVFYYQPHMWMQIDRDKFIEYAKWSDYPNRVDTIIASGYFNYIDADGCKDFDHVFIANGDKSVPDVRHVAYHDGSYGMAMRMLRELFPEKSRFEMEVVKKAEAPRGKTVSGNDGCCDMTYSDDPSPATKPEISSIIGVSARIRDNPKWNPLLSEVSRAEELRLFGVAGWRRVWSDIVYRWNADTNGGSLDVAVASRRSDDAAKVVNRYLSDPDGMRTVRFGIGQSEYTRRESEVKVADPRFVKSLKDRVRDSLRERAIRLI